jgi:hypothetical protein
MLLVSMLVLRALKSKAAHIVNLLGKISENDKDKYMKGFQELKQNFGVVSNSQSLKSTVVRTLKDLKPTTSD